MKFILFEGQCKYEAWRAKNESIMANPGSVIKNNKFKRASLKKKLFLNYVLITFFFIFEPDLGTYVVHTS